MSITIEVIGVVATIGALLASGGALYVSMSVKASINQLKFEIHRDIEDRFMKRSECVQFETARREAEKAFHTQTTSDIEGIRVEVRQDKNDLNIQLRGILSAIEKRR